MTSYNMDGKSKSSKGSRCKRIAVILTIVVLVLCVIGLAIGLALTIKEDNNEEQPTVQPPVDDADELPKSASGSYRFGAVAVDSKLCSQVGTHILAKKGGNAVDAAIASLICNGVVHAQSMGIGGGFFMTIYNRPTKEVFTLISREVAPLAATEDMYVNGTASSTLGGMAIAVPGEIAGYAAAHERFGKLEWSELFEPTIKLCEEGYPISGAIAGPIDRLNLTASPTLKPLLLKPDGSRYKEGDIIKRPLMAQTLRRISQPGGANDFYNGSLADDIVADIQQNGGIITKADLGAYQADWKEPVCIKVSNGEYTLCGPPPPSSAGVLQYILNILDGYNLTSENVATTEARVLLAHRLVEAMKFGYGKRSHLGDEDYVNVTSWVELLQSDSYADSTRAKINDDAVLPFEDYEPGFEIVSDSGTAHISVYTPDGSAVSVTSTINLFFGSKVRGSRTGIIFNNEMDDFSTPGTSNAFGVPASPSNYIEPGKRPMSSMSPTIVVDRNDEVRLIAGASGGTRIISGTLEVAMNNLWLGYDLGPAVDEARIHHQLLPNEILHESILDPEIQEGLKAKGHKLVGRTGTFCVVQAIAINCTTTPADYSQPCVQAVSDYRKGGVPDGY